MLIPLGKKSLWTTQGWLQTHFYCGCSHRAQSRTSFLPEQLLFPQCMEQETQRWWENRDPSAETWSDSRMNQRHKSGVNTNRHCTPGSGGKPDSGILACLFVDVHRRAADIYSAFGTTIPSLTQIDAAGMVRTVRQLLAKKPHKKKPPKLI